MRTIAALAALGLLMAGAAQAQSYDPDDRGGPPRYDHGGYDRPPPRYRHDDDDDDDDDRPPPPHFVCFVEPPFPLPHRRCPTHPGRPGSPCHCGGSPFEGHREPADRDR